MADAVLDLIVNLKDNAASPLAGLKDKAGALGPVFAGIGVAGVAAVASVATAALGAISATLAWSEKLDGLGDVLGTTGEESAALTVAIQHVGGDVEKITGQMSFFQKGLLTAKGELGPTGEAAKKLGINVQDAGWKSLGASGQMALLATKVNALPDGLEKSQLMMQLFGKSGKDMSDVMSALADGGMDEALKKAKEWGLVLDEEAIAANLEFNRSLNDLSMMVQGVGVSIGTALMPFVIPMMDAFMAFGRAHLPAVREALKGVAEWIGGLITGAIPLPGIVQKISDAFGWLKSTIQDIVDRLGEGDVVGAFGMLAFNIATAFGVSEENADKFADAIEGTLGDVVGWVETNWARFTDGVVKVVADVKTWVDTNWPPVKDAILGAFTDAYNWVTTNWPGFKDSVLRTLQDVRDWIDTTWTTISTQVTQAFSDAKVWVETNWPLFKDAVVNTLGDVKTWIETNWPLAMAGLQQAFVDAKTWVDENWPLFKERVLGVLTDAKTWVDENWPAFKDAVVTVLNDVVTAAQESMPKVKDAIITSLTDAKTFWQTNGEEIKGVVSTNWQNIVETYQTQSAIVVAIQKRMWGVMSADAGEHKTDMTGTTRGLWDTVTTIVTLGTESIKQISKTALALINGDTKAALNEAKSLYQTIFGEIKRITGVDFTAIHATIALVLGAAVQTVARELNKIKENFTTAFSNAIAAIRGFIDDADAAGAALVNGILSGIRSRIGGAEEAILGPIRSAVAGVERTIASLWAGARSLAQFVAGIVFPRNPAPGGTGGTGNDVVRNPGSISSDNGRFVYPSAARGGDTNVINVTLVTADVYGARREIEDVIRRIGQNADARVRLS